MAAVAVHDEEPTPGRVFWPRQRLKTPGQPLVAVNIGRPAAAARREMPISGCLRRYPGIVGVLCLENQQRRNGRAGSAHALNRGHHSCLLPICFQLLASRMLTKALDD